MTAARTKRTKRPCITRTPIATAKGKVASRGYLVGAVSGHLAAGIPAGKMS